MTRPNTTVYLAMMTLLGTAACERDREPERGPLEQAGHDIDREARRAGDDIDMAADEAGEAIDEAAEDVDESVDMR
jgi:hypothetical protein